MTMQFDDYWDARKYFQMNKHKISVAMLEEMLNALDVLLEKYLQSKDNERIADLILDVECHKDYLTNPDLFLHVHRKKKKEEKAKILANHIVDTSEENKATLPMPDEYKNEENKAIQKNYGYITDKFTFIIKDLKGERNVLDQVLREIYRQVLVYTDNNRTTSARLLGVTVKTLYNKIDYYNLEN